jgi:hypothetical protein
MGFSVLNPQYESIQRTAKPAFTLGTLLGFAPFTKGLPVGASIKPINLSKGIFNPEITMQEMLRVRDIPTVERVQRSMDLVGEKKFQEMVESQFKQYKPTNQTQEAMLVESVTLDILGRANRDPKLLRGLPGLKIPAPQQAALDLAQQRAALPVEQSGLNPFTLYHGGELVKTPTPYKQGLLTDGVPGVSFTPNIVEAARYAKHNMGSINAVDASGLKIYQGGEKALDAAYKAGDFSAIKGAGFDGVKLQNSSEYVLFDPEKVLSLPRKVAEQNANRKVGGDMRQFLDWINVAP